MRSYAQIARRRFELGVPVDDLIRSYRFSLGLIADTLTGLLDEAGVSPRVGLDAYRQIWSVSDAYTTLLVAVYRQHQLRLDTRNHEIKMDFLTRLSEGPLDDGTLNSAQTRFHLRPDVLYRGFVAGLLSGE